MSGLQTIINKCSTMAISRRKMVGVQVTKNERPRTSEIPTVNPWRFTLTMESHLPYYNNRDLIEALDTLDRNNPQIITFGNLPCLNWIFRYQGTMSSQQIANIRVQSFVGNQLVLTNLPVRQPNSVLFEANDLIQIGNFPHPFTTRNQVLRGNGNTVTITTHRPNVIIPSVVNSNITVGANCQFRVFCPNMPTYRLIPGAGLRVGGQILNNALIEFTDEFNLMEWI